MDICQKKYHLRSSYFFQTGIGNWWSNYLQFVIVLKSTVQSEKFLSRNNGTSKMVEKDKHRVVVVAVLTIIPATGLLLAFFVFVSVDSNFWSAMKNFLSNIFRGFQIDSIVFQNCNFLANNFMKQRISRF